MYRSNIFKLFRRNYCNNFSKKEIVICGEKEKITIGGKNNYFSLKKGFEGIKQIGIIGWGSQAPSQACNLKNTLDFINSPIEIKIGIREESKSKKEILKTGLFSESNIDNIPNVLATSDLNLILISDYAQTKNYKTIFKYIKPESTLGFSHGFLLGYLDSIGKKFPENINIIMMAPKGMGPTLRDKYKNDSGINSSVSVYQDVNKKAMDYALSWGIGVGSPYIFETSMQKEYVSDLFGERAILLGGVHGIVEYLFRSFTKNNPIDKALKYSCDHLTSNLSKKISNDGLLKVFLDMNLEDKIEFKKNYVKSYCIAKDLFEEIYNEVESGNEIRSVVLMKDKPIREIDNSYLWSTKKMYELKNIKTKCNKFKIHPKTSGIYIGAMMAQIDILIEKRHCYSEIVNESVIEATDSLNPYMDDKGISHMIDNCSRTARLGARKWAPRLDYLLSQNMDVEYINMDIFKNFLNHNIHDAISKLYSFKK